jgi:DNA-binding GntR family transcriptional regulator
MGKKQRIMDAVRGEVISGMYPDGARMPGVVLLCDRFDVSPATAVYAMRALAAEGILEARQGDGYFAIAAVTPTSLHDATLLAVLSLREIRNSIDEVLLKLDRAISSDGKEATTDPAPILH